MLMVSQKIFFAVLRKIIRISHCQKNDNMIISEFHKTQFLDKYE